MVPVLEAGGGESEGFEMAEAELIEHASHGDDAGTARITSHAEHWIEERQPDDSQYGEADGGSRSRAYDDLA
ncbi:hypothetical protein DSM112329_02723 [Paraconexibacter sp. AEG42_29]|uniref:Uncharacterized protein n=2 Tax=Paraconexibacter sp. AEG42_29 TaxID=2997339 RepID=A0AAU7AW49_9ACTN